MNDDSGEGLELWNCQPLATLLYIDPFFVLIHIENLVDFCALNNGCQEIGRCRWKRIPRYVCTFV